MCSSMYICRYVDEFICTTLYVAYMYVLLCIYLHMYSVESAKSDDGS